MVIVLDTAHCSASLSHLVKNAEKEIILVSPYLQISPVLLNHLRDASSRNVEITLIYRDDKLTGKALERLNEEKSKLDGMNIKMLALENLHAKCYLNEFMAIITSMNLYQHSQQNNTELGMLIQQGNENDPYDAIRKEVLTICRIAQQNQSLSNAKPSTVSVSKSSASKPSTSKSSTPKSSSPSKSMKNKNSKEDGFFTMIKKVFLDSSECYCIRCGVKIENNGEKPLCGKCYNSWARYKNVSFEEKYCLGCGKPAKTTYSKPLCGDCYDDQIY